MTLLLSDLPPEVLFQILLWVPPVSIPAFQQVCRKFNDQSQPILWRHHCRTRFKYWNPEHDILAKFAQDAAEVDWKNIYRKRHLADAAISHDLEKILSTQIGRMDRSEKIIAHGYDAKDNLLRHLNVSDDADDVLARRYYSDAVLGGVHRIMAIQQWVRLKDGQPVPLEKALAAFDQFVLHDREGDLEEVSALLDGVAQSIRLEHVEILEATPRRKAQLIAGYLRKHELTGVVDSSQYHNLRNNFIGLALQGGGQAALPLISVGIFCAVAKRLGLVAEPCGFPFHVYAIVRPEDGFTLDGRASEEQSQSQLMYMDPFRSDKEIFISDLEALLKTVGVPTAEHEMYLGASSIADMVRRTARNIIGSIQATPNVHHPGVSNDSTFPELDSSLYSALWALLLLPEDHAAPLQRARSLPYILDNIEKQFTFDIRLAEMYMLPLFEGSQYLDQLRDAVRVMRAGDSMPKQVKSRTPDISKSVHFAVGQVFRHKRYNYRGVITGWDVECAAGETWMSQMGVDRLSRGRHQSFYHVLVEDKSVRYVAEENIVDISIDAGVNLMSLAGRHFKRYDQGSKIFVSNLKDEYPDD
ncbi:MAG: hypothetical protein LQ343_002062 [Gyalolechia ehrenbergii]|nr:MAG: hypothetical protein LQ343_002062 [Gyalolechia ehrenbergii]